VRDQLASAVDLVVQVARAAGGARRVVAVAEVAEPGAGGGRAGSGGGVGAADSAPRVRPLVVGDDVVAFPTRARWRPAPAVAASMQEPLW
jgi:hypothetical protein